MLKQLSANKRPRVRGINRGSLPSRPGPPAPRPAPPADETETTVATAATGFDEEAYFINKQNKEKFLAEKAKIDAEAKRTKHAENIGTLLRADVVQTALETEHQKWLSAVEDWRQDIMKRMGKLGIPIETQEAIGDMIRKQTVAMRQKRAIA